MRLRHFLIAHSSRSIRMMVKRHILADLGDVELVEAINGKEALQRLSTQSFDLVLCDYDLGDMRIAEVRRQIIAHAPNNKAVDMVAFAASAEEAAHLAEEKFTHIVELPFHPSEFVSTINRICNPRQWRKSNRFHIPNAKAVISVWGMDAEANLINISQGGVLVEVSGDRSDLLLQNNPVLTLNINVASCKSTIKQLPVKLARLNVVAWNDDYKPILMRLAYTFLSLNHEVQSELEQLLQLAEEDGLFADDGQDG
jgi:CheY-like chemotaxis protein